MAVFARCAPRTVRCGTLRGFRTSRDGLRRNPPSPYALLDAEGCRARLLPSSLIAGVQETTNGLSDAGREVHGNPFPSCTGMRARCMKFGLTWGVTKVFTRFLPAAFGGS